MVLSQRPARMLYGGRPLQRRWASRMLRGEFGLINLMQLGFFRSSGRAGHLFMIHEEDVEERIVSAIQRIVGKVWVGGDVPKEVVTS